MIMSVKEQIEALRKELEQHNYKYYVLSAPVISDQEFDAKMRTLQELEAAHPSPLARGAFFGCRHFSRTNEILAGEGLSPIDWQL